MANAAKHCTINRASQIRPMRLFHIFLVWLVVAELDLLVLTSNIVDLLAMQVVYAGPTPCPDIWCWSVTAGMTLGPKHWKAFHLIGTSDVQGSRDPRGKILNICNRYNRLNMRLPI